ncbi:unnamed protein product [Ectocarpus sp. 13 AM-2016]
MDNDGGSNGFDGPMRLLQRNGHQVRRKGVLLLERLQPVDHRALVIHAWGSRCGPSRCGERLWCGAVCGSGRLAVGFQGPVLQRVQRQQARRRPGSPETVRGGDPRTSLPKRPQPAPPRGLRAAAVQGGREGATSQVPGAVRSGSADGRGKRRPWADRAGRKTPGWRRDGGRYSGLPPRRERERTAERRQGAGQGGGAEARAGQPRREPRSYPGPENWPPLSNAGLRLFLATTRPPCTYTASGSGLHPQ